MSESRTLKEAEKKAIRMATNDGLWEILLGLTLISFTASAVLRDAWGVPLNYIPTLLVVGIGIPAMRALKKSIILPRIGHVQFSQQRRKKFKSAKIFLIALVILTWVLWLVPGLANIFMNQSGVPYWFIDALFGLLIFVFFVFLSYAFETSRFIVYGLLFGISLPADVILQYNFGITFPVFNFLAGLVMASWGFITFIEFLRQYPPLEGELARDIERNTVD